MELPSLFPTRQEQILEPRSAASSGVDSSPDLPPQLHYYPSPTKDAAAHYNTNGTKHITHDMASPSHMNAMPPPATDYYNGGSVSPRTAASPKMVTFELMLPGPQYRARLPLRVSIFPHDTTDSIVTTVKNFYGLYSSATVSKGVSFEDKEGNTLIARYENLYHDMIVYVRVIEEASSSSYGSFAYPPASIPAQGYYNGDSYAAPAPGPHQMSQHISRPASRTSRRRSVSPNSNRGRRSDSASTNHTGGKKGRSRSSKHCANGELHSDSVNGYSSGDGEAGSVSGKKDHIVNTEISLDNIVEGGRRKRAKFESSELPLFAPPQMPAATSNPSVSPARRIEHHHRQSMPYVQPGQNPFTNPRLLQSPQNYNHGFGHSAGIYTTPAADNRRNRNSIAYPQAPPGMGPGMSMMPTPDPTVGSCMSEEDKDVAMQLMRLGDMSNISHGRTSASTMDDTFSGKADAASTTGATSEEESDSDDEAPPARRQKLDAAGNHNHLKILPTTESHFVPHDSVEASADDADYEVAEQGLMAAPKLKNPKPKYPNGVSKPRAPGSGKAKVKSSKPKVKKTASVSGPMSPTSLPHSRKPSIASNANFPLAPGDEEHPDLSSKPRCQRCRKSKKGCDRQRPCGRCRDAGLPAEMCISEDEGNGRKGRYGRHMGVPIKQDSLPEAPAPLLPAAPITTATTTAVPIPAIGAIDKNKKRKR